MNDLNLKLQIQYNMLQINCKSFNYEIFTFLKKIQCNFDSQNIFPNEIISIIMVLFTYKSIHPNNICECKELECIKSWNILMKNKKLYKDQEIIHCECEIIYKHYTKRCHNVKFMKYYNDYNYKSICSYCKKKMCDYCLYIPKNNVRDQNNLMCESCFINNK